jgi:hypothetical protein
MNMDRILKDLSEKIYSEENAPVNAENYLTYKGKRHGCEVGMKIMVEILNNYLSKDFYLGISLEDHILDNRHKIKNYGSSYK